MPEVAGEAALLVDPFQPISIAGAMSMIAKDKTLREALISKGLVRKDKFTWQKTADLLWNSIIKAINQ
jgi:glycosyltransferase involved in cell wall biosynthesis